MSPKKRKKENIGLPERWRCRYGAYYYRVPEGQEKSWDNKKEFRLGKTLSEAHRTYSERIDNVDEVVTMADLVLRYSLEVTPTKSEATQKAELSDLKKIAFVFGDAYPSNITTQHAYKLRDGINKNSGPRLANRTMSVLSHLFTKAIEWGVIEEHPMIGKFRKLPVQTKRRVPDWAEVAKAVEIAPPMLALYIQLKLLTGLRMTDLLSMKKTQINEHGITVTISKSKNSAPKTIIFEWDEGGVLKAVVDSILTLPGGIKSFYLFSTKKGQPYIKDDKSCWAFASIWRRWQSKCIDQGLIDEKFSEKSLRNLVGSEQETAEKAAELLAHTSTTTTRKHYRNKAVKLKPFVRK